MHGSAVVAGGGRSETAPTQRDLHLRTIAERGRMGWQKSSGYNLRAKVEASIGRYKGRSATLCDLGLNDDHFELHNLIGLLEGGNSWDRYRYAVVNNTLPPDLPWVHEAVGQLFEAVEPQVIAWATNNSALPTPSTIWRCLGKPFYEKQPVPSKPGP